MPSRTRKFRGSRTHGRGVKAGRGAGKQGGRGNAGLHKYKFKSMLIYAPDHFGRHGFKRPQAAQQFPVAVNVGELESLIPQLRAVKALTEEGTTFVADLSKAGVDRLLGGGKAERTWKVYVPHASQHAKEKVTLLESPPGSSDRGEPALPKTPGPKPSAPKAAAPAPQGPPAAPAGAKSAPKPKAPPKGGAPGGA
jgi:large subunit ribosomal protein L15